MSENSERLLRLSEVENRTGFKRTKIEDEIRKGNFPQPVRFGPRANRWVESEISQWIHDRVAELRGQVRAA